MLGGEKLGADLKFYRIGELAQLAEVSTRTIDYYTQIGVLKERKRTNGNHRLYSEDSLTSIKIIKQLQEQHFSLDEVCQLFNRKNNTDFIETTLCVQELLKNLQKKVVEIYSNQINTDQLEENKVVSRELIVNGLYVIQSLLVLLGEHFT